MKKIKYTVFAFSVVAVASTTFIWWDTAPAKTTNAKYRLQDIGSKLGPETRWPAQPGPAIHTFYCIGSEKDCGKRLAPPPAVVHAVPEPGTLALIGLGLALMLRRKKKPPPAPAQWRQ